MFDDSVFKSGHGRQTQKKKKTFWIWSITALFLRWLSRTWVFNRTKCSFSLRIYLRVDFGSCCTNICCHIPMKTLPQTHGYTKTLDAVMCVCVCHRDAVKWQTRQLLSQVENETTAALRLSYLHPVAVSDARTFFSSASLVVPLSILERKWRRVVYRGHAVVTGLGRKTSAKSKHKHGAKICHSFISVVS